MTALTKTRLRAPPVRAVHEMVYIIAFVSGCDLDAGPEGDFMKVTRRCACGSLATDTDH